jgi:hypothetical protein
VGLTGLAQLRALAQRLPERRDFHGQGRSGHQHLIVAEGGVAAQD